MMIHPQDAGLYRLIDANADRAAEALRVVCDVVRFVLNDAESASEWRTIRSDLWSLYAQAPHLQSQGLQSRDTPQDVGQSFKTASHQDVFSMVRSNIHRAQESFRTLEEAFRSLHPALASSFSALRYRCYTLEPPTLDALAAWSHQRKLDFHLYVVLGQEFSRGRDFIEVAEKAMQGGADCIQLRDKSMPKRELLDWAYRMREKTREYGATFIMNDHLDIALAVEADGIHLGQDDFPVPEARRIAGPHFIIGASTHSVDQARKAVDEGASYINIGPIFATNTKSTSVEPVTPELISDVTAEVKHPFTVMGGIKLSNVDQVLERGARRIAVVTAVVSADDITAAARQLSERIRSYDNQAATHV